MHSLYVFYPFISYIVIIRFLSYSILFISIYFFIYFIQSRSENHFCENAPCLKIISIIIILLLLKVLSTFSKTFQSDKLCITDMVTTLETTLPLLDKPKLEKGPQYKKFKEGYCEETAILQEEPLSYFEVFDPREMPLEHAHLATYGNRDVKSLFEHFSNNYLTEEEETSIISMWLALCTRLVRQKAISPNDAFSNLLASRPHGTISFYWI